MTGERRIGLALGGGGARGLAHIALLEAFDEMNITPAVIAGCSMGALVGACYAAGMSAKELRLHAEKLLANRVDFARYVFGARKTKPLELLSLKGLASMHLDGERLADLALPDNLPRNIEETRIPLKIIACDYERMEEVVFTSGRWCVRLVHRLPFRASSLRPSLMAASMWMVASSIRCPSIMCAMVSIWWLPST